MEVFRTLLGSLERDNSDKTGGDVVVEEGDSGVTVVETGSSDLALPSAASESAVAGIGGLASPNSSASSLVKQIVSARESGPLLDLPTSKHRHPTDGSSSGSAGSTGVDAAGSAAAHVLTRAPAPAPFHLASEQPLSGFEESAFDFDYDHQSQLAEQERQAATAASAAHPL